MTRAERDRFVRALLRMKRDRALPHRYDQYPEIHEVAFNNAADDNPAHLGPAFCTWHRYFLARFEQDLQAADKLEGGDGTIMLPYWDWVNDDAKSPNRQRGQIWHDDFLGGNGSPVVNSGPFRAGANWTTVGGTGELMRDFGGWPRARTLPRRAHVEAALRSHGFDTAPFDGDPPAEVGLPSPPAPSVAGVVAGSLGPGVYQVMTTYVNAAGETRPSPPTPVCLGGACTPANTGTAIRVLSPPAPAGGGATGWRVYVTTAGGDARDARRFGGLNAIGGDTTIGLAATGPRRPSTNTTSSFRNQLEGFTGPMVAEPDMHNRVHMWVGGSMEPGTSPDDPVFFLHHCNIDRLWALWQQRNPGQNYPERVDRVNTLGIRPHGLRDSMPPWHVGAEIVTSEQMLDHTRIVVRGRPAGYTYDTDPIGLVLDVAP